MYVGSEKSNSLIHHLLSIPATELHKHYEGLMELVNKIVKTHVCTQFCNMLND